MNNKRMEFSPSIKRKIYSQSNKKCYYCIKELGVDFASTLSFVQVEIDHIIPCKLGGSNDESNGRISCRMHNRRFSGKMKGGVYVN